MRTGISDGGVEPESVVARADSFGSGRAYDSALLQLSSTDFTDLESALARLTELSAEILGAERVGLWVYEDGRTAIACRALYLRGAGRGEPGARLQAADFPAYFRALDECLAIVAHDAFEDLRTREFRASYLEPLGITSMLDVPVRVFGSQIGVLCHEHVGAPRHWNRDEVEFATAIASLASLAFEHEEYRKAEAKHRESEERFRTLAAHVPGVIYLCRNDPRYSTIYLNDAVEELTGYSKEEFISNRICWMDLYHPEDAAGIPPEVDRALAARRPFDLVYRLRRRSGEYRWIEERGVGVFADGGGGLSHIEGFMSDITERRHAEEELQRSAFYDVLTGLPNRALFLDRLGRSLIRARREASSTFAVLFLDLDRFKVVNDSLGHGLGDELLRAFADRLRLCLRESDTVARLGGDEFTLLLENTDLAEACHLAERIRRELQEPFRLGGQEVFSTASIGIALSTASYERPEEILRDADTAMYRAKAQGRARHEVFDQAMHARAVHLLRIETHLRHAVERGELTLVYQPIVELRSGKPVGCEALLRWRHPERGLLCPEDFLHIAEETGLIVPIGDWVLEEVCRELVDWRRLHTGFSVSVNLSGRQLARAGLPEVIMARLAAHELPTESLCIEVTEHSVVENLGTAEAVLRRLQELDLEIHLDDFGTGYSSLVYLQRLPIDTLKVDRTFVGRLGEEDEGPLVPAILGLAASLGLVAVAEGVETEIQSRRLRDLGCRYAQGRFFASELTPREMTAFLSKSAAGSSAQAASRRARPLRRSGAFAIPVPVAPGSESGE